MSTGSNKRNQDMAGITESTQPLKKRKLSYLSQPTNAINETNNNDKADISKIQSMNPSNVKQNREEEEKSDAATQTPHNTAEQEATAAIDNATAFEQHSQKDTQQVCSNIDEQVAFATYLHYKIYAISHFR